MEVKEVFLAAASNGQYQVIKTLINSNDNLLLNYQNENGLSALMLASKNGHSEVSKLLLASGAKVDLQTEDGLPALMVASQEGHRKVVQLLLASGAQVDLQMEDGCF